WLLRSDSVRRHSASEQGVYEFSFLFLYKIPTRNDQGFKSHRVVACLFDLEIFARSMHCLEMEHKFLSEVIEKSEVFVACHSRIKLSFVSQTYVNNLLIIRHR